MNSGKRNKLNHLLTNWPHGTVMLSAQLQKLGISQQLLSHYVKANWLRKIGQGAFARVGDPIDWTSALYAIQTQSQLSVHVGGKTALELWGIQHFAHISYENVVCLFGKRGEVLPRWFAGKNTWDQSKSTIKYFTTNLFNDSHVGLEKHSFSNEYKVILSSPERAVFELLYLVPTHQTLIESKYLIEGLMVLRPDLLQSLLEHCQSVKVKRLFLFLADLCHLPCLDYLDLDKINLGKGKRKLGEGGCYVSKYQISVPKNFADTFKKEIEDVQ